MNTFFFEQTSGALALCLLALMALAVRFGHRMGAALHGQVDERFVSHVSGIQGSALGVLALILGFTFSLALQRHDGRSSALVNEANAIGTAMLRAQLVPASVRGEVARTWQEYVDVRAQGVTVTLDNLAERQQVLNRVLALQGTLWAQARRAVEEDPTPSRTGLYIQSLNDAIDAFGLHDAALARHVPGLISAILTLTFLCTAGIVGYAAGIAGHRPSKAAYLLVTLIVVLEFIILDLDRPRRGFIRVDPSSLVSLKAAAAAPPR